jgi:hypothetical protein
MAIAGIYYEADDVQYVFKKYELEKNIEDSSLTLTFNMIKNNEIIGERVVSAPPELHKKQEDLKDIYQVLIDELGIEVPLQSMDWELNLGESPSIYNSDDLNEWAMGWAVSQNILEELNPAMPAFLTASSKNTKKGWDNFLAYATMLGLRERGLTIMNKALEMGGNVILPE